MGSLCYTNVKQNGKTFRYAVFVCDILPEDIKKKEGTYFESFKDFYTRNEELNHLDEEWIEYDVYKNEFPTHTEILSFSGIIITGSTAAAYDDKLEWILKLRRLVYKIMNKSIYKHIKLIGHCFGHQIIAQSLKHGKVSTNPLKKDIHDNFEIGTRTTVLNDNFYKVFPCFKEEYGNISSLSVLKFHRDAVVSLPHNAILLGSSKWTKFDWFTINNQVLSFQGHPEYPISFVKLCIKFFLDIKNISQQTYVHAMESMEQEPDHHIWSKLLSEWLRRN